MNLLLHSILLLSPVLDAGHVANLALLRCALLYLQILTLRVIGKHLLCLHKHFLSTTKQKSPKQVC